MRNSPLYKQLKVLTANYTIEQVENATMQQVCKLLDVPAGSFTNTFFKNMKMVLINNLQAAIDIADEERIRLTLDAGFPGWEKTAKGREFVTVVEGEI